MNTYEMKARREEGFVKKGVLVEVERRVLRDSMAASGEVVVGFLGWIDNLYKAILAVRKSFLQSKFQRSKEGVINYRINSVVEAQLRLTHCFTWNSNAI